MNKKTLKNHSFLLLLLSVLASLTGLAPSHAETTPEITEQIQREKEGLKKIEDEIEKQEQNTIISEKKEHSLLFEMEVIDRRANLHKKEAALLEIEIQKKEDIATILKTQINEVSAEIEKAKKIILDRVESIYKEKQSASLKILFASQDYPDLLRKIQYLKMVAQKEDQILSLFKEKQAELEAKTMQLSEVVVRMIDHREALARKLLDSRTERKKKDRLLARVRTERELFKKSISEMTHSSKKVQDLISALEEKKKALSVAFSGLFSAARGHLQWPNNGTISAGFGRQKHPKFDEMVYRKGIEITPTDGGEVKSVFDGTVVYADWFRGYGMMVMIDHGESYYSLYAHLEKLLVSVGDRVNKDRTLGEVGGTGLSHGSKLYFEIRHQGLPTDPLSWLQKKR